MNYGTKYWHCKCDCGREKDILGGNLREGKSLSCGCLARDRNSEVQRVDITGKRSGHIVALYPTDKRRGSFIVWRCRCDCGREFDLDVGHFNNGQKTCGQCGLARELIRKANTIWNTEAEVKLVHTLYHMLRRCYNKNSQDYPLYGGRGIRVCEEWRKNRKAFVEWGLLNGYKPGLSIDRIDNDGPYAPWNCRWTNAIVQANNRRANHYLTVNDERKSVADWARASGLPYANIMNRIVNHGDAAAEDYIYRNMKVRSDSL